MLSDMTQAAGTPDFDQWRYEQDEDSDGDCRKLAHFAINEVTEGRIWVDYTPYEPMPHGTFQMLVQMGFPPRRGLSPWRPGEVADAFKDFCRQAPADQPSDAQTSFVDGVH